MPSPRLPGIAACLVLLPLVALTSGCSSKETTSVVTGTVTLDGAKLEAGQIRFVPLDGQSPTAGAVVADGQYSLTVAPGEKTVEISSPKEGPARRMYEDAPRPAADAGGDRVPARYNAQSELRLDVRPGAQQHDFALQSK